MGKNNGYIFVWRQLRENSFYTNSKAIHIWLECLFRATYKERAIYKGREKIELQPGQFIMGYREFGETLKLGASTVKYWLDQFETERMIERKSNAKGTKVTVMNWEDFQDLERIVERKQNANETEIESNNVVNTGNSVNEETTYTQKRLNQIKDIYKFWLDKLSDVNNARLTKNTKRRIDTKIDKYKIKDIELAIDHYDKIYHSDYYYSHNWTLQKFVKQSNGLPRFISGLDEEYDGDLWKDYQQKQDKKSTSNTPHKIHPRYKPEKKDLIARGLSEEKAERKVKEWESRNE